MARYNCGRKSMSLYPTNGTFAQHVAATDGKGLYISAHYIRPNDESPSTIDSVAPALIDSPHDL